MRLIVALVVLLGGLLILSTGHSPAQRGQEQIQYVGLVGKWECVRTTARLPPNSVQTLEFDRDGRMTMRIKVPTMPVQVFTGAYTEKAVVAL